MTGARWRNRAAITGQFAGSSAPSRSIHSPPSSAPAPASKFSDSHSPQPKAPATSAGSRARNAPSSASSSAPRLISKSCAHSVKPCIDSRLEIALEQGFVQLLGLRILLLRLDQTLRQIVEGPIDLAGLPAGSPQIQNQRCEILALVQLAQNGVDPPHH